VIPEEVSPFEEKIPGKKIDWDAKTKVAKNAPEV